jgi:hypothetical protein
MREIMLLHMGQKDHENRAMEPPRYKNVIRIGAEFESGVGRSGGLRLSFLPLALLAAPAHVVFFTSFLRRAYTRSHFRYYLVVIPRDAYTRSHFRYYLVVIPRDLPQRGWCGRAVAAVCGHGGSGGGVADAEHHALPQDA